MTDGWPECGTCGGDGIKHVPGPVSGRIGSVGFGSGYETLCPDCVDGLMPPDVMVVEVKRVLMNAGYPPNAALAQNMLLAAARWEGAP